MTKPYDPNWRDKAACLTADPEIFFPNAERNTTEEALTYCARCQVVDECAAFAKKNNLEGVFGGRLRGVGGHVPTMFCRKCEVGMRPTRAGRAQYPGTRQLAARGLCMACYRAEMNQTKGVS